MQSEKPWEASTGWVAATRLRRRTVRKASGLPVIRFFSLHPEAQPQDGDIKEKSLRSERQSLSALCRGKAATLQNYPPVPFPSRDALAIKVFKQRNRILPRDAGQFFESRHVDRTI